jgi:hypothetical protein
VRASTRETIAKRTPIAVCNKGRRREEIRPSLSILTLLCDLNCTHENVFLLRINGEEIGASESVCAPKQTQIDLSAVFSIHIIGDGHP